MKISILTLFPEMFTGPFDFSILKRAKQKGLVEINLINFRDFATDKHKSVDDRPYGGGVGMILRVDVLVRCLTEIISKSQIPRNHTRIILTDARGETFSQNKAQEISQSYEHLIIIAGHYEGVDERIINYIDEKISIGNFILTGGEIPAMIMVDAIVRLIPNVLASPLATQNESFTEPTTLEHPQYTRPPVYKNMKVPEILLSGNHKNINNWKNSNSEKISRNNN
jgi:tRNA (guanine37-N1)-methyltransferase